MSTLEVPFLLLISVVVFVAAVMCVGIGLSLLHTIRENRSILFMPMLILLASCGILDVLLSGRSLQTEFGAMMVDSMSIEASAKLPVKLLLGLLTGLAIVALASKGFQSKKNENFPAVLALSFIGFYVSSNLVPAAFGYLPVFSYGFIYTPIILSALFVTIPASPQSTLRIAKAALLLIVASSLVAAIALPSLALQISYKGVIPGFNLRLWGLTSHANVLGPAALTLCLIEWAAPFRIQTMHRLSFLLGFCALLLSQSKTSVIAAGLSLFVIGSYRFFVALRSQQPGSGAIPMRWNSIVIIFIALSMLATVALLALTVIGDSVGATDWIFNKLAAVDLSTASGRTAIWNQAITEGLKYPLFGYGPALWGTEYRFATGLTSAFHAHNQFLQVFSVSGLFGLLGFAVYLAVLGRMSFGVARASRGVSIALFAVLLVRSLSEVPVQFGAFAGADFLSHLGLVLLVGSLWVRDRARPEIISESAVPVFKESHAWQ